MSATERGLKVNTPLQTWFPISLFWPTWIWRPTLMLWEKWWSTWAEVPTQVIEPANYAANEDFVQSKKIIWNKEQKKLLYGRGKSYILHRMIQGCAEAEGGNNYLISFLLQQRSFVRCCQLDALYGCSVKSSSLISCRCRELDGFKHRCFTELSQETLIDMCLCYLKNLTEKDKRANIVVDEVKLKSLAKRNRYVGSLWMAISSVSKYNFKDQTDKKVWIRFQLW